MSETLAEFADSLGVAADKLMDEAKPVVSKGCLNIKNDARRRVDGYAHLPQYPRSITYDVTRTGGVVTGEVGPDKNKRQGPLGNLIEYGSINNAPIPHLAPALDAEEPRFVRALEDMAERLLEGKRD